MLTVAKFDRYDLVNTPGTEKPAFTIWFSGCSQHCEGCYNQRLWDPAAGKPHSVDTIIVAVATQHGYTGVDDIVFLGGEPMEQNSSDLEELSRKLSDNGFRIWMYTSWELDEIPIAIKRHMYTIKCGRYDEALKCDGIPSSSNQKFYRKSKDGGFVQITLGGSTT